MTRPATLGDCLAAPRRRRFVGRASELERFRTMLAGERARRVLFVHGPGGIAKLGLSA